MDGTYKNNVEKANMKYMFHYHKVQISMLKNYEIGQIK